MSRSRRKTPIVGYSTARSEADDKRWWHKRWRARERDQLAGIGPGGDPLPVHRQEVVKALPKRYAVKYLKMDLN